MTEKTHMSNVQAQKARIFIFLKIKNYVNYFILTDVMINFRINKRANLLIGKNKI